MKKIFFHFQMNFYILFLLIFSIIFNNTSLKSQIYQNQHENKLTILKDSLDDFTNEQKETELLITLNNDSLSTENLNKNEVLTNINDTTQLNNSQIIEVEEIKPQISRELFYYGNTPRYTITGNLPYVESNIDALNLGLVTAGVTTLFVMQHIAQANTIWKDKSEFKILEDGSYAVYADKPGHIIGTYMASYSMTEALLTSGLDWETSVVGGGLLGFAYNTYVEVLDGYGANFGFSPSDMYANAFGSGFYIAQYYVPFLQNVSPKFTYFPANWHGERQRTPHDFFIDDYSSHTLWFSFNVYNMFGENFKEYWPQWLELSIGYAARNLTDPYCRDAEGKPCSSLNYNFAYKGDKAWGDPKIIFALDYNLVKLLPDGGSFWNWAKQTLNFFKLPAPAIEVGIGGKTRFFLIYPFPIN